MSDSCFNLGYNTNGLAHHALPDAIALLADIGYRSIGITLDHHTLNPYGDNLTQEIKAVGELLRKHNFSCVIETGARYLLNPRTKHEPTLVSPEVKDRARRVSFLKQAIDIASELGAECVSLWSGVVHDGAANKEAIERLVEGLREIVEYADKKSVVLGFEPEPGMLIDTMEQYSALLDQVPGISLTLDIGHLHCQGELPIEEYIARWADRIVNIHLEDMRHGVHEHLMFGEGEMKFASIITAIIEADYRGPLQVELSRHSHEGPNAAQQAFDFLQPLIATASKRSSTCNR